MGRATSRQARNLSSNLESSKNKTSPSRQQSTSTDDDRSPQKLGTGTSNEPMRKSAIQKFMLDINKDDLCLSKIAPKQNCYAAQKPQWQELKQDHDQRRKEENDGDDNFVNGLMFMSGSENKEKSIRRLVMKAGPRRNSALRLFEKASETMSNPSMSNPTWDVVLESLDQIQSYEKKVEEEQAAKQDARRMDRKLRRQRLKELQRRSRVAALSE